MRILISTGYWQHKTNHSFSKKIKELCPAATVAVYGSNDSTKYMKGLVKNDNELVNIIYNVDEIQGGNKDRYYDELKEFEKGLSGISLWHVISTNRGVNAYNHGFSRKSPINYKDKETILFEFAERLFKMRMIFSEFNPDLYYESPGMDGWSSYINQQLCMEREIPYLILQLTRVKNYFAFSDLKLRFPQIEESYQIFKKNYTKGDNRFSDAEELYDVIMNELETPDYFDRVNSRFNFALHKPQNFWKRRLFELLEICRIFNFNKRISSYIKRKNNINKVHHPSSYDEINFKEKYLYYTLHVQPEYSTDVQGNLWTNQIHTIELLSKSVPCDWLVYVKEHPGTLTTRQRPKGYFDEIRKYPNVKLVNVFEDMHKLITNAQLVAVVTGTAGWEAIQRGIPTISFATNSWDFLGLSRKCTDIERLPEDIVDEVNRIKKISLLEKKIRIICYLAAIQRYSFPLTYPNQYVFTEPGSNAQYIVSGNEMAEALVKHLDYLKNKK